MHIRYRYATSNLKNRALVVFCIYICAVSESAHLTTLTNFLHTQIFTSTLSFCVPIRRRPFFLLTCVYFFSLVCAQGGSPPFSIVTFFFAWWAREILTYFVYFKAILHPRTVKWGKNTYHLSLGGHTELLHGPNGSSSTKNVNSISSHNGGIGAPPKRNKSIDQLPLLSNEATPVASQTRVATATGTLPKTFAGIATAMNNEHAWRHFTQNGYIRSSLDHQHIALISDA